MDKDSVTMWLAVVGLSAVALALVFKNEFTSALTVAAMVTPGALQMRRSSTDGAKP